MAGDGLLELALGLLPALEVMSAVVLDLWASNAEAEKSCKTLRYKEENILCFRRLTLRL